MEKFCLVSVCQRHQLCETPGRRVCTQFRFNFHMNHGIGFIECEKCQRRQKTSSPIPATSTASRQPCMMCLQLRTTLLLFGEFVNLFMHEVERKYFEGSFLFPCWSGSSDDINQIVLVTVNKRLAAMTTIVSRSLVFILYSNPAEFCSDFRVSLALAVQISIITPFSTFDCCLLHMSRK